MNTVQVSIIEDYMCDLNEITATLGFIQTAFEEGKNLINMKDASDALFLLYRHQNETLKNMAKELNGGGTNE